jgi:hypothetical protein
MEFDPLPNQAEWPRFEGASQQISINGNRCPLTCPMGMDMRHGMVGFVPVHVDRDAIEGRDSRHGGNRLAGERVGAANVFEQDRWYLRPESARVRHSKELEGVWPRPYNCGSASHGLGVAA